MRFIDKRVRSFALVRAPRQVWNHLYATCDSKLLRASLRGSLRARGETPRHVRSTTLRRFSLSLPPSIRRFHLLGSRPDACRARCAVASRSTPGAIRTNLNEERSLRFALTALFPHIFLKYIFNASAHSSILFIFSY